MLFYVRARPKCTFVNLLMLLYHTWTPFISITRVILCAHGDVVTCNSNTDTQLRTSLDVFLLYKGPFSSVTRLKICTPLKFLITVENKPLQQLPRSMSFDRRERRRGTLHSDCIWEGLSSGFSVIKNVHCA